MANSDARDMPPVTPAGVQKGVYAMQYAFFGPDGTLNRDAMRRQLEGCMADGVHGIAILGIATEVRKLTTAERRTLMDWVAEDLERRLPLSITIYEQT